MALDGVYLRHIKQEIENEALGARVNQIYQPNRDELVMTLRTYSGTKKLLLSARANSPRVNFCENTPENPAQPPMFCMLLRKRLGGGKLIAVRQLRCDRVLFLDFACINELGDEVFLTVACEIMGMYSNIIVLNRDTQLIVDALKRVDLTVSSKRLILPNLKYELPEEQDKLSLLTASPEKIAEKIKSFPAEMALSKAALQAIQGISPIIARELEYRVMEGATNRPEGALYDKLLETLFYLKGICEQNSGVPCTVYREDGKPMDVAFLEIRQYGGFMRVERGDGFNAVIDRFYDERDRQERMRVKTHSLNKLLRNHRDRVARKLQKQHIELQQCADREALRIRGDLLQANLYRVERGADSVTVENFYDENGGTLTIRLNPAISPAANAQRFYKDYQKAKNAESFLTEQLAKGEEELRYLDSVLDEVSRAESERELAQILNVSRTAVREGIRLLEVMGVVESRQGSGNYISGHFDQTLEQVLTIMYALDDLRYDEIREFRYAVERQALVLAVRNADKKGRQALQEHLNGMLHAETEEEQAECDRMLHLTLVEMSANRLVIANYAALTRTINRFIHDVRRQIRDQSPADFEAFQACHRQLVEAVVTGNLELGKEALDRHFTYIAQDIDT